MKTLTFLILLSLFPSNVWPKSGEVSYYGLEACRTACGQSIVSLNTKGVFYGASPDLPCGTRVRVTHAVTRKSIEVVILDRGPAKRLNRILDLPKHVFKLLENPKNGIFMAEIEVIND